MSLMATVISVPLSGFNVAGTATALEQFPPTRKDSEARAFCLSESIEYCELALSGVIRRLCMSCRFGSTQRICSDKHLRIQSPSGDRVETVPFSVVSNGEMSKDEYHVFHGLRAKAKVQQITKHEVRRCIPCIAVTFGMSHVLKY